MNPFSSAPPTATQLLAAHTLCLVVAVRTAHPYAPPACPLPTTQQAAANNNAAASVASPSSQGAGAGPTPAPGSANNAAAQRQDVPAGPGGAAPGQALPARSYYPALSDSDDEEPLLASARRHEAAAVEDVAVGGGSVGAQVSGGGPVGVRLDVSFRWHARMAVAAVRGTQPSSSWCVCSVVVCGSMLLSRCVLPKQHHEHQGKHTTLMVA